MKTKLSLSVLFLIGLSISIIVIQAAEAADPREKWGLWHFGPLTKTLFKGKKLKMFREEQRNHYWQT